MYRNIILIIGLLFAFSPLKAQIDAKSVILNEVSGIVTDTADHVVTGATVTFHSLLDSIQINTNDEGIFIFKNVKSSVFTITVKAVGLRPSVFKYTFNPKQNRIILDPLILKAEINVLDEVKISSHRRIVYKTDTVEYNADDYAVRENSTIDELLKKMEGMQVGNDGSLIYMGKRVLKAKLNGKDYFNGDVGLAIRNLPAEIAEKVQIIDDYGEQAARTGIKDGEAKKVLNITTKAERSVGNMIRVKGSIGTQKQHEGNLFLQRINANEQIGMIGNVIRANNGIAAATSPGTAPGFVSGGSQGQSGSDGGMGSFGASGGSSSVNTPTFSYSSQWGKKTKVNAGYSLIDRNTSLINSSEGQQFSPIGTTYFKNESNGSSRNLSHRINLDLEYEIDSANFLKITPSFIASNSSNNTSILSSQSGLINQQLKGTLYNKSINPNQDISVFYQHVFKKPKRIFSVQSSYANTRQNQTNLQYNNIIYLNEMDAVLKDSVVSRQIDRINGTRNLKASLKYTEPLSKFSLLDFSAIMNHRKYKNNASTGNLDTSNTLAIIDSLNSNYNYSYTEARISVSYNLNKPKFNLSAGIVAIPSLLRGDQLNFNSSTNRKNLFAIPIARFQYVWSLQQQFSINYSGSATEPSFNQLQPIRDVSNPVNPVVGNPNLKPAFLHSINLQYNNYIPGFDLNIIANANGVFIRNQIVANSIFITDAGNSLKNETHYVNLNGYYLFGSYYDISKYLEEGKYNLSMSGTLSYGRNVLMSNTIRNYSHILKINQRFGPKINPGDWLEINPFIAYDYMKSTNSIPGVDASSTSTFVLSLESRVYFFRNYKFGFSANKNFVKGINANVSRNPFVVNLSVEKTFFSKKDFTIGLEAFDLFNQNNFINRIVTNNEIIDTKTNTLSRYLLFNLRFNLQKWGKMPMKNGKPRKRKGDGSFLN